MRNNKGNIEILLLLCCLVGVVAFFSLSFSLANVVFESEDDSSKNEGLIKEKEEKEALLRKLEEEKGKLLGERQEKESFLFEEGKLSKAQRGELEEELDRLKGRYNLLARKIKELKDQLLVLSSPPDPEVIQEKMKKEAQLRELEKRREELERQRREKEMLLAHEKKIPPSEREEIKRELNRLNEEYDGLIQEIERLKRRLAALPTPDYEGKEKKEEEWEALQRELEELKKEIEKKEMLLAAAKGESGTDSLEEKIAKHRMKLEEIQQRKEELNKEIEDLEIKILTAGTSNYKNPLYVDCKKEVYIFYPGKEMVPVTELERRSLFEEKSAGHDAIILFVRPDGFEGFRKAYDKVEAMSIALCYEPLENGKSLDGLKGVGR